MTTFLKYIKDTLQFFKEPIKAFFMERGWENLGEIVAMLIDSGLILLLVWGFWEMGKAIHYRIQARKMARDLIPFFELEDVQKARQYYIQTKCQNINPARQDEPGQTAAFVTKEKTIPFFLTKAFKPRGDGQRFYLVLAGSGMGKTTFMLNLYRLYVSRWRKRPYDMRLFPFGNSKTEEAIQELVKKKEDKHTILLLDAFDEDKAAMQGKYRERLDHIMDLVQGFREVVITSRTQFFESEDHIPGEINIPRSGPKPGFHHFKRLYVSPFDENDIKQFIRKKYGVFRFWNRPKKQKAKKIALGESFDLMARPMLLANIDDLLASKDEFTQTHQIYEALIEAWLQREADRVPESKREKFKQDLYDFSRVVALHIFGKATVDTELTIEPAQAQTYAQNYNIDLSDLDLRSRSLLNVKAEGAYKFSHKSILEYFLALEMKNNARFYYSFMQHDLVMDMAKRFANEMVPWPKIKMIKIEGGPFQMVETKQTSTLSDFFIAQFPITQSQWEARMGNNPSHFKDCPDCPVEQVSWQDTKVFIEKLNERSGLNFRLPTEAEWEFAAKGGKQSKGYKYAGSNNINEVAWSNKNSKGKTHPVGMLNPNELGLYDMSGNVWEWCEDWYDKEGSFRVMRGGSWDGSPEYCRPSFRGRGNPGLRDPDIGFRLALSL